MIQLPRIFKKVDLRQYKQYREEYEAILRLTVRPKGKPQKEHLALARLFRDWCREVGPSKFALTPVRDRMHQEALQLPGNMYSVASILHGAKRWREKPRATPKQLEERCTAVERAIQELRKAGPPHPCEIFQASLDEEIQSLELKLAQIRMFSSIARDFDSGKKGLAHYKYKLFVPTAGMLRGFGITVSHEELFRVIAQAFQEIGVECTVDSVRRLAEREPKLKNFLRNDMWPVARLAFEIHKAGPKDRH